MTCNVFHLDFIKWKDVNISSSGSLRRALILHYTTLYNSSLGSLCAILPPGDSSCRTVLDYKLR